MLINKRESTGLKYLNGSKTFIKCSYDIDDIFKNIEEYNIKEKRKILIVFDDMIVDMLSYKNLEIKFKVKHFSCFYYTILVCCTKKY